ncbi:MAG: peptidase T [Bacteroidia bacterium]|nr:peptidase T [Bacteroidia bacterium]
MAVQPLLDRFLRYVQIDTQSDPDSPSCPSTEKQKDLGRLLVAELQEMGIADAELDGYGYVYATIPATASREVPAICFCAHMDTSPDCSGAGVKPIVHRNYQGQDLVLPDDPAVVIRLQDHPDLARQTGQDLITASGLTLLGADNKAGVAAIMAAADHLVHHPEISHGPIRLLFTPDEEIGRGADRVDLARLGARYGYTVDGETLGSLEDETFSADSMRIQLRGVSAHPGFAKGHMQSALKAAGDFIARLPKDRLSPESTDGTQGFVHPVSLQGTVEEASISLIIRDFSTEKLAEYETYMKRILDEVLAAYPGIRAEVQVSAQYRNMKEVLVQHPQVVQYAEEAIRRAGLMPLRRSIRGGTDGARLSFMGLPCPNLFAGEHAFHSRQEWVSVRDMEKSAETLVHLAAIWAERA